MRMLRKRFTCVNRNNTQKNQDAMNKIIVRYCKKKKLSGWKSDSEWQTSGNDFFVWEHYVSFYKLSKKDIFENNKNVAFFNNLIEINWSK